MYNYFLTKIKKIRWEWNNHRGKYHKAMRNIYVFDEKNKSCIIINLTDEGKSAVFTLLGIAYKWEAKFFENYSIEDKKRFISMISDYYKNSINDDI